jgi:hypothetical protein
MQCTRTDDKENDIPREFKNFPNRDRLLER